MWQIIKCRVGISKKKRFSQHGESTDITINKYVHENAIAEVLRVVHFIVWMWNFWNSRLL